MSKIHIIKPEEIKRGEADLHRIYPQWGIQVERTSCGLGLFAARNFTAGEMIGPIEGIFLRETDYDSEYSIDAGYPFILEPFAPFCYLNHCCDPNARIVRIDQEEREEIRNPNSSAVEIRIIDGVEYEISDCLRPSCIACPDAKRCRSFQLAKEELEPDFKPKIELQTELIRAVRKGEQITVDYAWPASMAIPCRCGSPKCRKWIVDKDEFELIAESLKKRSPRRNQSKNKKEIL
ncbi:MAG: hypothetical protein Q4G69_09730 [Planctomycetia bacterium]|nr:hypothetical protein [Planctomycetia bacterium]